MKPIATKEQTLHKASNLGGFRRLFAVGLVLIGAGSSHSESVYRCGNSYSGSAQCTQETATEVNAHTEPRQHAATPHTTATQDQHEADALEKKRLQSERLATQNQPARVVVVPGQNQTATTPVTPRHGQRMHRPPSPYFTARDPNKPIKKTTKD